MIRPHRNAPQRRAILALPLAVLLVACATAGERPDDWAGGEIAGVLRSPGGEPVAQALVYAYRPGQSILGPAEAMSEPSTDDGKYILVVPPGQYAVVARKRLSGATGGPLRDGDLFGRLDDTASAGPGSLLSRDIVMGTFAQGQEGDPRKVLVTGTRISGSARTADGRPVEGAHAFAYSGRAGSDSPDCLSAPTGPDGGFVLSLPRGGIYVIGARTGLRGRPRADDLVGYWGTRETVHEVAEGSVIQGVVITMGAYGPNLEAPEPNTLGKEVGP